MSGSRQITVKPRAARPSSSLGMPVPFNSGAMCRRFAHAASCAAARSASRRRGGLGGKGEPKPKRVTSVLSPVNVALLQPLFNGDRRVFDKGDQGFQSLRKTRPPSASFPRRLDSCG